MYLFITRDMKYKMLYLEIHYFLICVDSGWGSFGCYRHYSLALPGTEVVPSTCLCGQVGTVPLFLPVS